MNCTNFNFGKYWDQIVPYLTSPTMKMLIKTVFDEIKRNSDYPENMHYRENEAPAQLLSSYDSFYTMRHTMVEWAIKCNDDRIPEKIHQAFENLEYSEDEAEQRYWDEYNRLETAIEDALGVNYETNQTHIACWVPFGTCHWYNKRVGLFLAKKVCPKIHWKLLISDTHTTVISDDGKHMFDLLAFCYNHNRFDAICCNKSYEETDQSLGAKESIELLMKNNKLRFSTALKGAIDFDPLGAKY
jgi:hypothetical protein